MSETRNIPVNEDNERMRVAVEKTLDMFNDQIKNAILYHLGDRFGILFDDEEGASGSNPTVTVKELESAFHTIFGVGGSIVIRKLHQELQAVN